MRAHERAGAVAARLHRRKYQALLATLIVLLVIYPLVRGRFDARLVFDLLLTSVFLAAFTVVWVKRGPRWLILALGVPTVMGAWTAYMLPGPPRAMAEAAFHLAAALFLATVVAVILASVYNEPAVSADSVYGAFSGYLLVGLAFGHAFCVLEVIAPGSFRTGTAEPLAFDDSADLRYLLTYFSFMTLTTVGYGDVLPVTDTARGAAAVEAIAGQFYIAVLVAELIGRRVADALEARRHSTAHDAKDHGA